MVVIVLGVLEAAEPELMSVLVPVEPVVPVVPEAPIDVPLPVVLLALELVSVLAVPGVVVLALLELSVEGVVGAGVVLDVVDEEVEVSVVVVLPQPARARAAIRARAAALAIGLVCISELLEVSFRFVWRIVWDRQSRMRCLGTFWWANARSMSSATVEACRTSCALPQTDVCFFLQARA
ncbi:MAG TPA: hypothetical protein VLK85_11255 [Ramlibacter sp.]|nr:hypothetical protein [Ramlibacter sp.]